MMETFCSIFSCRRAASACFACDCRRARHSYAAGVRCAGYLWQAIFGEHRQAAWQMYNGCRGLTILIPFLQNGLVRFVGANDCARDGVLLLKCLKNISSMSIT